MDKIKRNRGRRYVGKRQKKEMLAKERMEEREEAQVEKRKRGLSRDQVRVPAQKTCPA